MATIAQITTDINTNFADNTTGAITPALLRTVTLEMLAPDNPTYATQVTCPLHIGGTGVASTLELRATSGVGAGAEAVAITVGNNGATSIGSFTPVGLRIVNGTLTVGTAGDASKNGILVLTTINTSFIGGIKVGSTFTGAIQNIASLYLEPVGNSAAAFTSNWFGLSISGAFLSPGGTSADYTAIRIGDCSVVGGGGTVSGALRAIWVQGGISEFNGTILGGRTAASGLTFQTTSGTGTTDKFTFLRGTNGATTAAVIGLGIGSVATGFSIGTTVVNDNFLTFSSNPSVGSGFTVGRSTVGGGTGLAFSAGAATLASTNTAGADITFLTGTGTGNATGTAHTFYVHYPVASGTADQALSLNLRAHQGNVICGNPAIGGAPVFGATSTAGSDGFLYIPTCAGLPTGVPTTYTGKVALVFNTTNSRLMIYNGSWLGATTPGTFV